MGYPTGILIDASKGTPTDNNITANTLQIQNTVVAGCNVPVDYAASASPTGWDKDAVSKWFLTADYGNSILTNNSDVLLTAPFDYSNPDITPKENSPLLSGASFSAPKLSNSFFSKVSFKGAAGASGDEANWWKGWTMLDLNL